MGVLEMTDRYEKICKEMIIFFKNEELTSSFNERPFMFIESFLKSIHNFVETTTEALGLLEVVIYMSNTHKTNILGQLDPPKLSGSSKLHELLKDHVKALPPQEQTNLQKDFEKHMEDLLK